MNKKAEKRDADRRRQARRRARLGRGRPDDVHSVPLLQVTNRDVETMIRLGLLKEDDTSRDAVNRATADVWRLLEGPDAVIDRLVSLRLLQPDDHNPTALRHAVEEFLRRTAAKKSRHP